MQTNVVTNVTDRPCDNAIWSPGPGLSDSPHVLLVEDDPELRTSLGERLTAAGFRVTLAGDAAQALALPRTGPDVLVSDIDLGPGLDGIALAGEARRRWPRLQIVLISGFFPNLLRHHHIGSPTRFLLKPFRPTALVGLVAELQEEAGQIHNLFERAGRPNGVDDDVADGDGPISH